MVGFDKDEDLYIDEDYEDVDVYDKDGILALEDNDEISVEEAAFMEGYTGE